ncbi:MAG: hypothetical protein HRU09_16090 [Oligoflexales bacterium]|nr:hypothetical protein [Oligoflexales bacterium]
MKYILSIALISLIVLTDIGFSSDDPSDLETEILELEHELACIDHTCFLEVPKGDMRMPYGFFYTGAIMEPVLNKLDLVMDRDQMVPRAIKFGIYAPFGVGGLLISHFIVHPTQVCYNKTRKEWIQWRLRSLKQQMRVDESSEYDLPLNVVGPFEYN